MARYIAVLVGVLFCVPFAAHASPRPPVIDVHLHALPSVPSGMPADWADRTEARALRAPDGAEAHMRATLEQMDEYNVVLAIVSGPEAAVRAWHDAAPGRIIGGATLGDDGLPEHSVKHLRRKVNAGVFGVLGELGLQYEGLEPNDPRMREYYDYLADEGVPLALHTGLGPPGGPHSFAPRFRASLGRPLLFEPVIASRPDLRAYLMHAGWPYLEETKALLYVYPDLYVDIGVLTWALPEEVLHAVLKDLVDAGLGQRILFGTDQMMWPEAVGIAIETIERVPFLDDQQKRDILYHNAARFLRLGRETIAAHHGEVE